MSEGIVKLSSSLPKADSVNGLSALAGDMASEPERMHVAVIVFDTSRVTIDTDSGDAVPTARVRRIEPITGIADRQRLQTLVTRAFEERTGKTVLPLEIEDELRAVFGEGSES